MRVGLTRMRVHGCGLSSKRGWSGGWRRSAATFLE